MTNSTSIIVLYTLHVFSELEITLIEQLLIPQCSSSRMIAPVPGHLAFYSSLIIKPFKV